MTLTIILRSTLFVGTVYLIAGCASMQPSDFAKSTTRFELDRYFVGHARSWGVFENTDGKPRKSFVCDSYGKRNSEGVVLLHQDFKFSDGKTQTRDWRIRRVDSTHWEATANDMVGSARGEGHGNALYWEYTISLNMKNPLATVHIRQWIYQPEGTDSLMTRLVITKMGITVSEVSEVIHHVSDAKWSRE
jgi:hypothetical protein